MHLKHRTLNFHLGGLKAYLDSCQPPYSDFPLKGISACVVPSKNSQELTYRQSRISQELFAQSILKLKAVNK